MTARKPSWLKIKLNFGENPQYAAVRKIVETNNLHTICSSGKCPNIGKCWSCGTATFMILGDICTRSCKFCATKTGKPLPLDVAEPQKVADSIRLMQLKHCVITSVDRDDLPDKGATHWASTVETIRASNPQTIIETLIPDFDANTEWLNTVIATHPHIIGHNLETVERLTPQVRSRAGYRKSLNVLHHIAESGITAKTGIMVGLGETPDEVLQTMRDARTVGVKLFTIGQYLQPTANNAPVAEYITPEQFEIYKKQGLAMGFDNVESGPLVRSSYMAEQQYVSSKVRPLTFTDWGLMDYQQAWDQQRAIAAQLLALKGQREENVSQIIFCEHPHVYTLGRNGKVANFLINEDFLKNIQATYYHVDRGGDITYHGPGQIVGYPILDLERLGIGLKAYIHKVEEAIIRTLQHYDLRAERLPGAAGVWLDIDKPTARKICAIGVHASRWVTTHGFALNVNTDLTYYRHINPCGFTDKGVTSIQQETGANIDIAEVKAKLKKHFSEIFNH